MQINAKYVLGKWLYTFFYLLQTECLLFATEAGTIECERNRVPNSH